MSKLAYVLSGGGARGSFQVGYLQNKPMPDVVLGCSAGALNAAGLAYVGAERLMDEWEKITWMGYLYNVGTGIGKGGLLEPDGIRKLLERFTAGPRQIPLEVNYCDLAEDKLCYGDDINAILASSAIPGLVCPVDGRYVDGGAFENAPVTRAIEHHGATEVHVISCFPLCPVPSKCPEIFPTAWIIYRALECALRKILVRDIERASLIYPNVPIYVAEPPVSWDMQVLAFTPHAIAEGIAEGRKAVLRRLGPESK